MSDIDHRDTQLSYLSVDKIQSSVAAVEDGFQTRQVRHKDVKKMVLEILNFYFPEGYYETQLFLPRPELYVITLKRSLDYFIECAFVLICNTDVESHLEDIADTIANHGTPYNTGTFYLIVFRGREVLFYSYHACQYDPGEWIPFVVKGHQPGLPYQVRRDASTIDWVLRYMEENFASDDLRRNYIDVVQSQELSSQVTTSTSEQSSTTA